MNDLKQADGHLAALREEIRKLAKGDLEKSILYGVSPNPYSTDGKRHLWKQGWEGVRPANLVDSSYDWRCWERGRMAREIYEPPPMAAIETGEVRHAN